jgi:ferredoxin
VASLNSEEVRANPPRLLWIGRDAVEFDLVAGALHDANIPELVEEGPTGILQKLLKSESQICVLQSDFEKALEIAARLLASRPDGHADAQKCHHCGLDCSAALTVCPNCKTTLIVERKTQSGNASPPDATIQQDSRFCPLCDAEFPATYTRCTICGIELVSHSQRGLPLNEQTKNDRLVVVWRGGDPVAISEVVSVLRGAGIRHHVESTHDYLVFGLAMPRPKYIVRVLQSDADKAKELLAVVIESPFFGAEPSSGFPEETGPVTERIANPWNLAAATVEIWVGQDAGLAQILENCLRENQIGFRLERSTSQDTHLLVMHSDEAQAREIVREVLESVPPP